MLAIILCKLCIVWLNMHIKYICMRMFYIVALPDSGVDGQGRYNMVSEPMVSTLSLDGLDKWSLDPRFRAEMVFGGTNFEP